MGRNDLSLLRNASSEEIAMSEGRQEGPRVLGARERDRCTQEPPSDNGKERRGEQQGKEQRAGCSIVRTWAS